MKSKQTYKEKQELVRNTMLAAGLVSDRFPGVSSIVFHMTYYQRAIDRVLMKRTLSFLPSNYACFRMDCMRDECTGGGFDLTPVVSGLVKARKRLSRGRIACNGKHDTPGHASITYEVCIEYEKRTKKPSH